MLPNQIVRFFDKQNLWKESIVILDLTTQSYTLNEGSMQEYHFHLGKVRCVSGPIRFQDLLIISITGKNQLCLAIANLAFVLFIFLSLSSNLEGVHLVMTQLLRYFLL